MLIYSTVTIPVVLSLVFAAVLFAAQSLLPSQPEGELVPVEDLLTEEDNS